MLTAHSRVTLNQTVKRGIRHICCNVQKQHVEIHSMQLQDNKGTGLY